MAGRDARGVPAHPDHRGRRGHRHVHDALLPPLPRDRRRGAVPPRAPHLEAGHQVRLGAAPGRLHGAVRLVQRLGGPARRAPDVRQHQRLHAGLRTDDGRQGGGVPRGRGPAVADEVRAVRLPPRQRPARVVPDGTRRASRRPPRRGDGGRRGTQRPRVGREAADGRRARPVVRPVRGLQRLPFAVARPGLRDPVRPVLQHPVHRLGRHRQRRPRREDPALHPGDHDERRLVLAHPHAGQRPPRLCVLLGGDLRRRGRRGTRGPLPRHLRAALRTLPQRTLREGVARQRDGGRQLVRLRGAAGVDGPDDDRCRGPDPGLVSAGVVGGPAGAGDRQRRAGAAVGRDPVAAGPALPVQLPAGHQVLAGVPRLRRRVRFPAPARRVRGRGAAVPT